LVGSAGINTFAWQVGCEEPGRQLGGWQAPPPLEVVFEVKTAPPHLFGQRLIVRYGDR
jgi:hypothetical protein